INMNAKKVAVTAAVAGALGGFAALGLGAGQAPADPHFPMPPVPPIPAPPIPHVDVPPVPAPRVPDVNVPPVQVPQGPEMNMPSVPSNVHLPDVLPNLPDVDDFFGLPGA